jgi:hypothetical protein
VRAPAKVKDADGANEQFGGVQKLWMKRAYPVDGSTTKKKLAPLAGRFVEMAGCGRVFVARFA